MSCRHWTIGIDSTRLADGSLVCAATPPITKADAEALLQAVLRSIAVRAEGYNTKTDSHALDRNALCCLTRNYEVPVMGAGVLDCRLCQRTAPAVAPAAC
jgi:hypothetical protein